MFVLLIQMLLWFLLSLSLTTVDGWSCYDYALTYPETATTIQVDQRSQYLLRLCGTIKACHAHPQLYSYDIYVKDVSRCYDMRMYNFDKTIFEKYRDQISGYIEARELLAVANLNYDVLNLKARDMIESIVNVVRLRDAYLREFRYSTLPPLTGDVFLLLTQSRATFMVESERQQIALETMVGSAVEQLQEARSMATDLALAYAKILNYTTLEAERSIVFEDVEIKIQENVIGSLLEIDP
jgi:hypothetical protein